MEKFKRPFLALSIIAISAASCGSSTSTTSSNSSSSTSASQSGVSAKKLFPNGITIVVGFGTGGAVDIGARLLAPYLSKYLGVPVVVQNMVGGGGITAAQYEYHLSPSSPTLLMSFLPALPIAQIIGNGKFNVTKLTPIYGVYGGNTSVLIAKKGSQWKDFASLQAAKGPITAATTGVGTSSTWVSMAFLSIVNHIDIQPVPFSSGTAGSLAALGGSVNIAGTTVPEAVRLINEGKAQGVLEFAPTPLKQLPGVESIAQVGKSSESFTDQLGLTGMPGMPKDEVAAIASATAKVVKDPAFINKANNTGSYVVPQTTSAWAQAIKSSFNLINNEKDLLIKFK